MMQRVMVAAVALIGAAVLAVTATGCWMLGCTLIGGEDGLFVEVEVVGGPLPNDTYTVVARGDGQPLQVEFTSSGGLVRCTTSCLATTEVDGHRMFLRVSLADSSGEIVVGIDGVGGPAVVELELWRGAALMAGATYQPAYQRDYPNGEGCDDGYASAHAGLIVAVPPPPPPP